MKNGVLWDVTPCGSCRFLQVRQGVTSQKSCETSILLTKTMKTPSSGMLCGVPEDGVLHSHRRENLKSYKLRAFYFASKI
jgi:hypothetical protein